MSILDTGVYQFLEILRELETFQTPVHFRQLLQYEILKTVYLRRRHIFRPTGLLHQRAPL